MLLGLMERFNYPNLQAVKDEEAEILYLLECESYGRRRDEQEEMDDRVAESESQLAQSEMEGGYDV